MGSTLPDDLAAKCAEKRRQQQLKIPKDWLIPPLADSVQNVLSLPETYGILTPEDIEITNLDDVDVLLQRLATGYWTSVAVTAAFCKRAIIAHQLVNCLTEFWIEDALARAKELDEIRVSRGPIGPLHGLPVSLKDQFDVGGKENNMGLASWLGRVCEADAVIVTVLREAGAVIYTRTNVPMAIMMPETNNHVYGRTVNPRNRMLTSGGSSGGEAALLTLKGSPLGVGTDLGGSIRNPAALNGLYGLRPTMRRTPYWGASNTLVGQESIESSIGPLSRTLSGCKTWFSAVMAGQPWNYDPKVVEMPWRQDMLELKHKGGVDGTMCFGYFDDDGVVQCQPPVRRAIKETVEALRAAGHIVIPWKPLDHATALSILQRTFASDSGEEFRDLFSRSGEPLLPGIDDVSAFPAITVNGFWKLCSEREAYRKRYLDAWMSTVSMTTTGREMDAVICPVAPFPAPPHDQYIYAGYTCVWNVLDLPSVSVPACLVDETLDIPDSGSYEPRSDIDRRVHAMYEDPGKFKGMPIGIQVVGRRWREEECLGLAEIVDKALAANGHARQ